MPAWPRRGTGAARRGPAGCSPAHAAAGRGRRSGCRHPRVPRAPSARSPARPRAPSLRPRPRPRSPAARCRPGVHGDAEPPRQGNGEDPTGPPPRHRARRGGSPSRGRTCLKAMHSPSPQAYSVQGPPVRFLPSAGTWPSATGTGLWAHAGPPSPNTPPTPPSLTAGQLVLALGTVGAAVAHPGRVHAHAVVAHKVPRARRDLGRACPRDTAPSPRWDGPPAPRWGPQGGAEPRCPPP